MRKQLRKSEIRQFNKEAEKYGFEATKKDIVEIKDNLVYINKKLAFFYHNNSLVPSLSFIISSMEKGKEILKKAVIDSGAVKFIASGADIMRPGITNLDDFPKESYVAIVDEKHRKAIAIGKAIFSSDEIKAMKTGKVILNIHHVGDNIWKKKDL